jgi:hypothetical protein
LWLAALAVVLTAVAVAAQVEQDAQLARQAAAVL